MKKLFLLLTLATASLPVLADDWVPGMTIQAVEEESSFELSKILSIKFSDTEMIVTLVDGTVKNVLISDVVFVSFADVPSAIEKIFVSIPADAEVKVFDVSGKAVFSGTSESFRLFGKKGVFVLKYNDISRTIVIK